MRPEAAACCSEPPGHHSCKVIPHTIPNNRLCGSLSALHTVGLPSQVTQLLQTPNVQMLRKHPIGDGTTCRPPYDILSLWASACRVACASKFQATQGGGRCHTGSSTLWFVPDNSTSGRAIIRVHVRLSSAAVSVAWGRNILSQSICREAATEQQAMEVS